MLRRISIARAAAVAAVLGVALIAGAIPAAAGGGGGCSSGVITNGSGATVSIENFCFEPTVLRVQAGDTVTWTNLDKVQHSVTGANNAWGDRELFSLDESVSFTFDQEGTFPYWCVLHPSMIGTVVVGDGVEGSPTVAAVASDGGGSALSWGLLGTVFGVAIAGVGATALRRRDERPST